MNTNVETFKYDNRIVRAFAIATVVWGIVGMLVGIAGGGGIVFPRREPEPAVHHLRPHPAAAHERGDFRVRRQRHVHGHLLFAATAVQGADVQRFFELVQFLGLAGHHRQRGGHAAAGLHHEQGIRGTGMADQNRHHGRLGGVRGESVRHHHQAPRKTHVRGHLVLHRHGRHRRGAAHHELDDDAGGLVQELFDVCRRAGRAGAMVVWPQRRRVLPDHAVSRPDVLFPAEGGEPADFFLPAFDHSFLGADVSSTSGPGRIICFTPRCRTGRNRSAWCSR